VILCPKYLCGHVEAVCTDKQNYAQYRVYGIKTASWVKECGRTGDWHVEVLVLPGKILEATHLPQVNSLITVYESLLVHGRKTSSTVLAIKEFSFLPKTSSPSTEISNKVAAHETSHIKGWLRPNATESLITARRNK